MSRAPIDRLRSVVDAELARPVSLAARRVADQANARYGDATGPILFYGSCLRDATNEGMLDVYLLPPSYDDFHRSLLERGLNEALPPNIYSWTLRGAEAIRAKVAVVRLARFAEECRDESGDSSTWARFCQPAALIHTTSPADAIAVRDAVVSAIVTAARWAALLGPESGTSRGFWTTLFRATYGAELRPERDDRPDRIYAADASRYDDVLRLAWDVAGIPWSDDGTGRLRTFLPESARLEARASWRARRLRGRARNAMRLLKGALTFDEPLDYLTWKIERHSGRSLGLTAWEREHPVLAAPSLVRRIVASGVIR